MFERILTTLANLILDTINSWGYWGIFILMTLESANLPLPSEIIMPFSGFLAATGRFDFWLVILIGALGNLVGSIISYSIAYWYGKRAVLFFSRLILIKSEDISTAEGWLKKYGVLTCFFPRLMPLIRTFISFPLGIFKVNFLLFSLLSFLGSLIWSLFLTLAGYLAGENWNFLEPYFRRFDFIIGLSLLIVVSWLTYRHLSKKVLN